MMRRTRQRIKRSQRGDTIVEVTLALTVLALVLGTSSVLANRNTKTLQNAQEKNIAVRYAQMQLEYLKTRVAANPTILTGVPASFCMLDANNEPLPSTDERCKKPNGAAIYEQAITLTPVTGSNNQLFTAKATVEWETLTSWRDEDDNIQNKGNVQLTYRVYSKLGAARNPTATTCEPGKIWSVPESRCIVPPPAPGVVNEESYRFPAWHLFKQATRDNASEKKFTFRNDSIGSAALQITTASISGTNSDSFSIKSNTCLNKSLAAGGACDVIVQFTPPSGRENNYQAKSGEKQAKLRLNSTNGAEIPEVELYGNTYSDRMKPGDKLRVGDKLKVYAENCFANAEVCSTGAEIDQEGKFLLHYDSSYYDYIWDIEDVSYIEMEDGDMTAYDQNGSEIWKASHGQYYYYYYWGNDNWFYVNNDGAYIMALYDLAYIQYRYYLYVYQLAPNMGSYYGGWIRGEMGE